MDKSITIKVKLNDLDKETLDKFNKLKRRRKLSDYIRDIITKHEEELKNRDSDDVIVVLQKNYDKDIKDLKKEIRLLKDEMNQLKSSKIVLKEDLDIEQEVKNSEYELDDDALDLFNSLMDI